VYSTSSGLSAPHSSNCTSSNVSPRHLSASAVSSRPDSWIIEPVRMIVQQSSVSLYVTSLPTTKPSRCSSPFKGFHIRSFARLPVFAKYRTFAPDLLVILRIARTRNDVVFAPPRPTSIE
jgi:hypothetical protein